MNEEEKAALYAAALDQWGANAQVLTFIEECGEAIQASCKLLNRSGLVMVQEDDLADEVADVLIMGEQMAALLGGGRVEDRKAYKLARLKLKLAKYRGD